MRCLVLGGTGALGSCLCRTLYREGARLAFTYHRRRAEAEALSAELGGAPGLACDLKDFEGVRPAVDQAARELGGLEALVQAAGVSADPSFYQYLPGPEQDRLTPLTSAGVDELLKVNARGSLAACQAAVPHLKASGGGNILLLAAIDGLKPVPAPVHYAMSQAALKGLVESLAHEVGCLNIRVNLLALGLLEGGLSRKVGPEVRQAFLSHSALGRLGKAQEVAEVAAWMALENTYVTGQTLVLDGGL